MKTGCLILISFQSVAPQSHYMLLMYITLTVGIYMCVHDVPHAEHVENDLVDLW